MQQAMVSDRGFKATVIMQDPVIQIENVNKRFASVSESSNSVFEMLLTRFSKNDPMPKKKKPLWVVRDINLDIYPGEFVGIIGQNGSGKSTLLKLLTRVLHPTTGRIQVNGRVSAMLELGTGFHPDLTGRENIFLNASILGLSQEDIEAHFDSVVAFSELEEFIDTPVKFYSSGMYMRLGFSIAIHVKPRILIVDEILAVGDQAFQEKCLNRIHSMKQDGVTVILVSHNLDMVRKLCTRLIWLEKGNIKRDGDPEEIIQQYLVSMQSRMHMDQSLVANGGQRLGTGEVALTGVRFLDENQQEANVFTTGDAMTIEISYLAHKAVKQPEFGLAIHRDDGIQINGPNTQFSGLFIDEITGRGVIQYQISELPLLPARYVVTVAVHDSRYPITYDHHEKAYEFQVVAGANREIFGLFFIPATWSWLPESNESPEPASN